MSALTESILQSIFPKRTTGTCNQSDMIILVVNAFRDGIITESEANALLAELSKVFVTKTFLNTIGQLTGSY
jgi:hypothetical protein